MFLLLFFLSDSRHNTEDILGTYSELTGEIPDLLESIKKPEHFSCARWEGVSMSMELCLRSEVNL